MARRKRTGNQVFPKRAALWVPFDVVISLTDTSRIESGDLLGNYFGQTGAEVPTGATIGPIRGRWSMRPTTSTSFSVANHIELVLQLNREGGRSVLPVPGVDIMDAMWYGQAFMDGLVAEVSAGVFNQMQVGHDFSTKAMRKITGNGQTLTVTAIQDTNTDYSLNFIGNVFLKLP